jgi:aromatic ring-opening dioxygenase LigB subunit
MAKLIAGMASSHAATFDDPSLWDEHRARNRQGYRRRYGVLPPENPGVAKETADEVHRRYRAISEGLRSLREQLASDGADTMVMIGDDQNENFTDANLPQIAIYLGESFTVRARATGEAARYRGNPALAEAILDRCVAADIDMASVRHFPDEVLLAHAFGPTLRVVDPEARVAVVPIFVNAIHLPAPSPRRCYAYGNAIRTAIEGSTGAERVAMYASGGMSHFTAGYPWPHYKGPHAYGSISEGFDREIMRQMEAGEGHALCELTNEEIIGNGEIELRSWITLHGAMGDVRPELLVYEPFYRAIQAMGVGYWRLS